MIGLLVTQCLLYGLAYAALAYLGVGDPGVYVSFFTLIYLVTVTLYSPLPRRLRVVSRVIMVVLVSVFLYFAVMRILVII